MQMELQARIDQLMETPKTILGDPIWITGQRPDTRLMRRVLLEDGESRGATLVSKAYPFARSQEFRHLIVFTDQGQRRAEGRCVCRLDSAPETDGPHINDFAGPTGYPAVQVEDVHYHDWAGNRHLTKRKGLPEKLLYARNVGSRIKDIDDGFWWFCQQNQIIASNWDVPGWPPSGLLV